MRVAVTAAVAAAAAAQYALQLLDASNGAVCLDGSPAGFYWSPGSVKRAVLWFEGGGWCQSLPDCLGRAGTRLGSSTTWPPTASFQGILNTNASLNPDFYNASHLFINYCDGSSFASEVADPVPVQNGTSGTVNLYFRGHRILQQLLATLQAPPFSIGSEPGWELIVSGSSAGGLSTFLHVDAMSDFFGPNVTVVGLPDAGFFPTGPDVNGGPGWLPMMQAVMAVHNISSAAQVDASCWVGTPPASRWQCLWASYAYQHVSARVFTLNSQNDWAQLVDTVGLPPACVDAPLTGCTASEFATFLGWNHVFMSTLNHTLAAAWPASYTRNGGFIASCIQHEEAYIDARWSGDAINGRLMRDAFADWYWQRNGTCDGQAATYWWLDGPWGSNPTCLPPGP